MLTSLRLKNFAVVEEAEVAFGAGLTVLTGETGAGKSILIDALGLLVGGRAEADVIRDGCDEGSLEGLFERSDALGARLAELGLPDDGPEVGIRRTIGRAGRGRAYVNGSLVTLGVLQRLMRGLVDIAGQHEHMALFDPGEHLSLVDRVSGIDGTAGVGKEYREAWADLKEIEGRLEALGGDESQVRARMDYLVFQIEEIDRVGPKPGEDTALELERRKLVSSERLKALIGSAEELLASREGSAVELLGRAIHDVGEAEKIDPTLEKVRLALAAAQTEVDEAARVLSRNLGGLEADPARLEDVDERLAAIRRLSRKHAAPIEGVLAKRVALGEELEALTHRSERRAEVEAERLAQLELVKARARALTQMRRRGADRLGDAVSTGLRRLAMAGARFGVDFQDAPLGSTGADQVQLVFSANVGDGVRPLAKVASGGEASRVMLAMKAVLAGGDACQCSVFDEADAGIGGAIADVVGRLLKEISTHRQVLCVTHLPQVAAHADAHLRIEKGEVRGRTRSVVAALGPGEERQQELARMLSGVEISKEAMGAAQALLRHAQRPMRARKHSGEAAGSPRVDQRRGLIA